MAPHPPAPHCEGAIVQVGHVEPIREQEITIETHEGAGIDAQRDDPGGGGQQEHAGAQRAVGQEAPHHRRDSSQRQFGQHAGRSDGKAVMLVAQLPGFVGIGIKHRQHHEEGHAHGRHAAAEALCGEGMTQLMQYLGKGKRDADAEKTGHAGIGRKGMNKLLPLARCEVEAKQRGADDGQPEARIERPAHIGRAMIEQRRRAEQRHAEKQIVFQQPPQPRRP